METGAGKRNFAFLAEAIEALPGRSAVEDFNWLLAKLAPRIGPDGWLDLGDGASMRFAEDSMSVLIENPEVDRESHGDYVGHLMRIGPTWDAKQGERGKPYRRGLAGNGFEITALHHDGIVECGVGGQCAELAYHLKEYFKRFPPRHEREQRLLAKISELETELRGSKAEHAKELEVARTRNRFLKLAIQTAITAIWDSRRIAKSKRLAAIREGLEEALKAS